MRGRKKKDESTRSRNVRFILYPDNDNHVKALDKIRKGAYNYLAVFHDRGLENDDDSSKAHYHVMIRFSNARWHTSISEELGIEFNLIQRMDSFKWYSIYCTHVDYEDKEYFSPDEFEGSKISMREFVENFERHKPKGDRIAVLRKWINNSDVIFMDDLIEYASSVNKEDLILSNSYLFSRLIDDHNYKVRAISNYLQKLPDDWKAEMRNGG